ncbi:MAG TPA: MmgE/PrpD family protein [Chloroflexota bacterium]|nr:MmgE/PrpD family protein [Chloroflexota bacterium]
MDPTQHVAEFVTGLRYGDLSARAVQVAKDAILDSVGVALRGSQDEAGRIAASLARDEAAAGEATVWGPSFRTSVAVAAFANGIATHALDFDFSFMIGGQPMAGLVATVFALAEASHATGAQLIEGYVAGYEVAGALLSCMPTHGGDAGWHSTGTVGTLGCAAAACRLLGLDVERTRVALGIATSMASGVVWNFGSMSKPLHAGLAARNGVTAARLAASGFSANPSLLDGPDGFFATFAPAGAYDLAPLNQLGATFAVEQGVRFKPYPCGGLTHTAVDATLGLCREESVEAADVERVEVGVTAGTARRIIYGIPATALQGKFSIPYIIGRAIVDRALVPDSFTDEAIRDPRVISMAERVTMVVDPELKDSYSVSRPSRVRIALKNGRALVRRSDVARGSPQNPLSREELLEKFRICARPLLRPDALEAVLDGLEHLETTRDVAAITARFSMIGSEDLAPPALGQGPAPG